MQFNSLAFAAFIAVVLSLYFVEGRRGHVRTQNVLLLASSYFFYGWWDARFLALILSVAAVDFLAASRIATAGTPSARKRWLALSLTWDLGTLCVFKYLGFFADSAAAALGALGFERVDEDTIRVTLSARQVRSWLITATGVEEEPADS